VKLKLKRISKQKYNRNLKEFVTHKTVIETKLIFETEISLITMTAVVFVIWHYFLSVFSKLLYYRC